MHNAAILGSLYGRLASLINLSALNLTHKLSFYFVSVPSTCCLLTKGSFPHSLRRDEVEFLLLERMFELVGKKVIIFGI